MEANDLVPVATAVIGALAALGGVALKALHERRAERRRSQREDAALFLSERRQTYDQFIELHRSQVDQHNQLRRFLLIIRDGGTQPPSDDLASFPPSPMHALAETLGTIRRLARTYDLVRAAEQMMSLHADLSTAMRKTLEAVTDGGDRQELSAKAKQNDDILYFVLCRMLEDRELEFAYAYRAELGIGDPAGGPPRFPVVPRERTWSLELSERIIRTRILPLHPLGASTVRGGPPDQRQWSSTDEPTAAS